LKSVKEKIARIVKEGTRNLYKHILLKEERKPILDQKDDKRMILNESLDVNMFRNKH